MEVFEQPEVARRIRAAMTYGGLQRARAAEIFGVSPSHLDRYTSGRTKYVPTLQQLWQLAHECDLSPDWFGADLSRLHEIVPDGMPVFKQSAGGQPPKPPGPLLRPVAGPKPMPGTGGGEMPGEGADSP